MLIIKTGSTIPALKAPFGDFEDWFTDRLGTEFSYETREVFRGDPLPSPEAFDGIVVTGSPAMVSHRQEWSEETARWLARSARMYRPVLGVCYGHQLIAHGLGGEVGPNPKGRQIGTHYVDFDAQGDPLLGSLGRRRRLQTTHVESVLRLPPGAVPLARTDMDPNHAFRIGSHVWAVQFHPEFDDEVMAGYLHQRRAELTAEGIDVQALLEKLTPAPAGREVLEGFARIVRQHALTNRRKAG